VALTLVQEDGSGVSGANSYASLDFIITFALMRGVDLHSLFDEDQVIAWAIRAMDFIESFRSQFKGVKTSGTQLLQWPRTIDLSNEVWSEWMDRSSSHVQIDGFDVLDNQIPIELMSAQAQLVIEQSNGVVLMPTSSPNATVKMIKIGPLTREFFAADNQPLMPAFTSYLNPLLNEDAGAFLHTVRI